MLRQRGFTLLEVLIAIAIVAILAGIALPSYTRYVTRSKIQEATTNLLSMRVKMEQYYQDNRFYSPPVGRPVLAPCAAGGAVPAPALRYFRITCQGLGANTYILRADGGLDSAGNVVDNSGAGLPDDWARHLWLSNADLVRLFTAAVEADVEDGEFVLVNGLSNNRGTRWSLAEAAEWLGFEPGDDAWSS